MNIPIGSGTVDNGLDSRSTEECREDELLEIRNENIRCSEIDYGERPNGFVPMSAGRFTESSKRVFNLKPIGERL